jgi:hypothetical protein
MKMRVYMGLCVCNNSRAERDKDGEVGGIGKG